MRVWGARRRRVRGAHGAAASRFVAFAFVLGIVAVAACSGPPSAEPERVARSSSAVVVCPAGAMVEGIDVSQYQHTIDWPAVAATGRSFAVARVAAGLNLDTTFIANWTGIKAAGMVRGAYQ